MASEVSSEMKIERFENEILDEEKFEENLNNKFNEQYDENIEDILLLDKDIFLNQIKDGVQLLLEDKYTDFCFTNDTTTKLISKCMEEIERKYNHHYSIINKAWTSYSKISKRRTNTEILFTGFRKHCINTEDYASHNCRPIKEIGKSNNCHFICVYSADLKHEVKFVFCECCKKVYYSTYILSLCNKCNVEYYTSLLSPEEDPNMLLATWYKYHCPLIINEKMKCVKCKSFLYINMKNGLLTCLNEKCDADYKNSRLLWNCSICKKDFKSEGKPYNPLEVTFINKLIEQTILLRHKAHPTKLPCCKLNIFFTDFYHNKECDGNLFESELNDKIVVVCEKCHFIDYFERFVWTCPKCGKVFKDTLSSDLNNKKNDSENQNNENDRKPKGALIDDVKEKKAKGKVSFTPQGKHDKYGKGKRGDVDEEYRGFKFSASQKVIENRHGYNDNNIHIIEDTDKKIDNLEKARKYRRFGLNNNNEHNYLDNYKTENNDKENKDDDKNENNDNNIRKSDTTYGVEKERRMKKFNTNKGTLRRFGMDKKDDNIVEKEDGKGGVTEIEIKHNMQNLSPRLMWLKKRQLRESGGKNILTLFSGRGEKEKKEKEEKEKREKEEKEKKENEQKEQKLSLSPNERGNVKNLFHKSEKDISTKGESTKKSTKSMGKKTDDENKDDGTTHILFENEDSEEDDEDDDMPNKVHMFMSKMPGVTENFYNDINKRMSNILERCKIPIIKHEDYVFDKKLGEGGYAVIFSVYKVGDENCVEYAMKKIIARSLDEIDTFTKEFELVYSCDHPNIMKIYGIGINMLDPTTYSLYVLMEKAKRDWDSDIKRHLKKKKNYSEKELINILKQLTNALLFMKQNLKISHRDIKPQNVLLFENGIYKIADFGEAKEIKITKNVNTLRGTELYMSPALYSGLLNEMHDVNHDPYKSDVFSLGLCFLYASTLNFQILYQVRNISNNNQMKNILKQQFKKKYSDTYIDILSNMMEIEESKRYDFSQLIEAINTHYDKEGNLKNA